LEKFVPQLSLHSPIGDITVSEESGEIVALDWGWGRDQSATPLLLRAKTALQNYFDGAPLADDLPLRQRVWQALREIPAGQTRTYVEISRVAGGSARSVGGANAANPIAIFIPCHRVVAVSGLGGYSGGEGLETKQRLLDLERGGKI
jgi:methylated-DNA-[protein]-cysteine S-methyltransferase